MDQGRLDELAAAIRERRADLGLSQAEVSSRGGPSHATLRSLEKGTAESPQRRTLAALEEVLGWRAGVATEILEGRGPADHGELVAPPADDRESTADRHSDSTRSRAVADKVEPFLTALQAAMRSIEHSGSVHRAVYNPGVAEAVDRELAATWSKIYANARLAPNIDLRLPTPNIPIEVVPLAQQLHVAAALPRHRVGLPMLSQAPPVESDSERAGDDLTASVGEAAVLEGEEEERDGPAEQSWLGLVPTAPSVENLGDDELMGELVSRLSRWPRSATTNRAMRAVLELLAEQYPEEED